MRYDVAHYRFHLTCTFVISILHLPTVAALRINSVLKAVIMRFHSLNAFAIAPILARTQSCSSNKTAAHPRFGYVPGNDFGIPENATYDYVVVGGGTAGLAVAYRLAEDGTRSVAVVEAGGFYENENGNTSVVPAYCTHYGFVTEESANQYPLVDWGFVTQPEEGLGGRRLHYGRGKTLGGRSVISCCQQLITIMAIQ